MQGELHMQIEKTSGKGPFVVTIKSKNKGSDQVETKYRRFESLESARDYLWAGSTLVRQQYGYKLSKIEAELLTYEDDNNHLVTLSVAFEPTKGR